MEFLEISLATIFKIKYHFPAIFFQCFHDMFVVGTMNRPCFLVSSNHDTTLTWLIIRCKNKNSNAAWWWKAKNSEVCRHSAQCIMFREQTCMKSNIIFSDWIYSEFVMRFIRRMSIFFSPLKIIQIFDENQNHNIQKIVKIASPMAYGKPQDNCVLWE